MKEDKNKIIRIVHNSSTLQYEKQNSKDGWYLEFATRENGDILEEEHSEKDVVSALLAHKAIIKEFGSKYTVDIETVDEWVCMTVRTT